MKYKHLIPIKLIKFCIVGGIGTLINLVILFSLVEWLLIPLLIGASIAFVIAVSSNYLLNKIWTFNYKKNRPYDISKSYIKFIIISLIGLLINLLILYILTNYFHMWYILSQIIAIGGATLWNFGGSKIWVFHR